MLSPCSADTEYGRNTVSLERTDEGGMKGVTPAFPIPVWSPERFDPRLFVEILLPCR